MKRILNLTAGTDTPVKKVVKASKKSAKKSAKKAPAKKAAKKAAPAKAESMGELLSRKWREANDYARTTANAQPILTALGVVGVATVTGVVVSRYVNRPAAPAQA